MSITKVLIVLSVLFAAFEALAGPLGTVHLKNGGRVHGELMVVEPGDHVLVRLADGTAKKIAWDRVLKVQDDPPAPAPAPAAAPAQTESGPTATIELSSSREGVTVSEVTSRVAMATSQGNTAVGLSWKTICTAPCSFQLPAGTHELLADGPGYSAVVRRFDLQQGRHRLEVRPGWAALRWGGYLLTTIAASLAVMGGVYMALKETDYETGEERTRPWALPVFIGGLVGTAGGITMMFLGSSSFEKKRP
jgi:hypothetical protein